MPLILLNFIAQVIDRQTVLVIVLFTIVSSCVTDCNFQYHNKIYGAPVTDLFLKCHLKLHIDTDTDRNK